MTRAPPWFNNQIKTLIEKRNHILNTIWLMVDWSRIIIEHNQIFKRKLLHQSHKKLKHFSLNVLVYTENFHCWQETLLSHHYWSIIS